jgi:hypothetical protein
VPHFARWLGLALSVAAASQACRDERRRAGGRCTLAEEKLVVGCATPATALQCVDLRLREVPCRGPVGCTGAGSCDQTVAEPGEPCRGDGTRESACSAGSMSTLVCQDGVFAVGRRCRGPLGCAPSPAAVACDQTIAEEADACLEEATGACSVDRKSVLWCTRDPRGGPPWARRRFALTRACPTAKGCEPGHTANGLPTPVCDLTGLDVGAPCGKGHDGLTICSPDGRAILKCTPKTLVFEVDKECPSGQRCSGWEGTARPPFACAPEEARR